MQLFEGYSTEELSRILTTSRWIFGILFLLAVIAGIFTQWLGQRVVVIASSDRARALERLAIAELELRQSGAKNKDLADTLGNLTIPRKLTEDQLGKLRSSLRAGPRGAVVITFLTTEWDAEKYARQIASLLIETGFAVKVSDYLWVNLDHDGLFVCLPADGSPLPHAVSIQTCFRAIGVEIKAINAPAILKETGVTEGTSVIVVSNRK